MIMQKNKYQKLLIVGTIFFVLLIYCNSNLYAKKTYPKKETEVQNVLELSLENQKLQKENKQYKLEIQSLQRKMEQRLPLTDKLIVIISVILIIASLLLFTHIARNKIFKSHSKNTDLLTQLVMNNTFGMPAGTVRGILAISIFIIMAVSIVIYYPDQIPDSIKVTASLVFGFYFAKNSGQLKDYMDRMLDTSQATKMENDHKKTEKIKETWHTIKKAQTAGANESSPLIKQAQEYIDKADNAKNPDEAEKFYDKAIQKAQMAQLSVENEAITNRKMKCNQLTQEISNKLNVLKGINLEEKEVQNLNNKLMDFLEKENYDEALNTADKLSAMINYALEGMVVKTLVGAKNNLDASQSLGTDGKTIIKSIFSIISKFKQDNNELFIDLLRKRITGSFIDASDMEKILGYIEKSGDSSKISKAINKSIQKFDQMLPMKLPENLKDMDIIRKILCVGKNELESLLVSPTFEDHIGPEDFYDYIKKIRNNIIDEGFSHIQLPDEFSFSEYKSMVKNCQNDEDGRGALKSLMDIVDIGKDILTDQALQKWKLLI